MGYFRRVVQAWREWSAATDAHVEAGQAARVAFYGGSGSLPELLQGRSMRPDIDHDEVHATERETWARYHERERARKAFWRALFLAGTNERTDA